MHPIMKELKQGLMWGKGSIRMALHVYSSQNPSDEQRLRKRGYKKGDLVSGIMTGKIIEEQIGFDPRTRTANKKYVIEGKDMDNNPIVIVIAKIKSFNFKIITVMPPLDRRRFTHCIN